MPGAKLGVARGRVVAVVATLPGGRQQLGSGYLVGDRLVLTAEHCTRDKLSDDSKAIRLHVICATDGASADVKIAGASRVLDVAVLHLVDSVPWATEMRAPVYARVDRTHTGMLTDCQAIGYPLMQRDPDKKTRDTAELHGTIYTTDEAESGRLLMREPLVRPGPVIDPNADPTASHQQGHSSPWGGLSGALVFCRGDAIGVVIQHLPRQGDSAIRLMAFDTLARLAATDIPPHGTSPRRLACLQKIS